MQFLTLLLACYTKDQTHDMRTYSQSPETLVGFAMSNQPSRALRKEQDETGEGKSGNNLYAERDTPLRVVGWSEAVESTVGDPGSAQCANTKHELLKRGYGSSDTGMGELGLI